MLLMMGKFASTIMTKLVYKQANFPILNI